MNVAWDAEKYTQDFAFVPQYGSAVLDWLDAAAGGSVLDLGCGNGALTKALHDRGYRAIGLDASEELLRLARKNYPELAFLQGDAADFRLAQPVDAVFSNAVLHWIERERQPDLLRCVFRALKPGGQLVFESGGRGNNRLIHGAVERAFRARGRCYQIPFYFPTVGEYAALLESAGFRVTAAVLFDRSTELKGENGMRDWLEMFLKAPLASLPSESEREAVLEETVDALRGELYREGRWVADYVRLRMKAIRP